MLLAGKRTSHCALLCALAFGGGACVADDGTEDLGTAADGKGDTALPRTVEIDVAPGASKRFRITTRAFVASFTQDGDIPAALTAKHLELAYEGTEAVAPSLGVPGDGIVRNWTLTIYNRGNADLVGRLVVDAPRATGELGIVSDIDKTVLPPETAAGMPPPYPGIAMLLSTLELRAGGAAGDVTFVTARTPEMVVDVPDWLMMHGVPPGPIETGVSGVPWIAQREKIADIKRVFAARPGQPFVLFGDTSHRDPEVYAAIRTAFPDRVAAIFIHRVNGDASPARVEGMHLVGNYAEAAAILFGGSLITEDEARTVIDAARAEGLAITEAEADALLDAAR
ncbi:MAG: DUF2183 domain-containing protein [Deltaproteobacteria bacterium]|nr:DUF2183 domain-containing protein [Deltaproteobacteria bacterium]